MEEGVEQPIGGGEAQLQILEVLDPVDGFILDDLFEHMGGTRPVDPAQRQETPVEP